MFKHLKTNKLQDQQEQKMATSCFYVIHMEKGTLEGFHQPGLCDGMMFYLSF